jgi:hypothetical protein
MLNNGCKNCDGTGWVSGQVPVVVGYTMRLRERVNPCHLCNAGGSWSQWAQEVVAGNEPKDNQ